MEPGHQVSIEEERAESKHPTEESKTAQDLSMTTDATEGIEKVKLSNIIASIFDPKRETVTFQELFDELEHHGLAILMILFSMWSALPVPAAGYSTILSIPLFFIGYCFLRGQEKIQLPAKAATHSFHPGKHEKMKKFLLRISSFLERYSKPRLVGFVHSRMTHICIGSLIFLLAASMALPIPGTNTLPAGGIFLIGFAMLEDDGFALVVGFLYSIVALCLTVAIIIAGKEIISYLIEQISLLF